jgi:hypothetical protein
MATTDHTSGASSGKPEQLLEQLMKARRTKLLQAHAIMICLREALLYAACDDTVIYAEAASAAAVLTNDALEGLDSVSLQPVFTALCLERAYRLSPGPQLNLGTDDDTAATPAYVC